MCIRDSPYCGASNNRHRLQEYAKFLVKHVKVVDAVQIYCSETRDRNDVIEHRYDVARKLEVMLEAEGVGSVEAHVKEDVYKRQVPARLDSHLQLPRAFPDTGGSGRK